MNILVHGIPGLVRITRLPCAIGMCVGHWAENSIVSRGSTHYFESGEATKSGPPKNSKATSCFFVYSNITIWIYMIYYEWLWIIIYHSLWFQELWFLYDTYIPSLLWFYGASRAQATFWCPHIKCSPGPWPRPGGWPTGPTGTHRGVKIHRRWRWCCSKHEKPGDCWRFHSWLVGTGTAMNLAFSQKYWVAN